MRRLPRSRASPGRTANSTSLSKSRNSWPPPARKGTARLSLCRFPFPRRGTIKRWFFHQAKFLPAALIVFAPGGRTISRGKREPGREMPCDSQASYADFCLLLVAVPFHSAGRGTGYRAPFPSSPMPREKPPEKTIGPFTGTVVDPADKPVAGVKVWLLRRQRLLRGRPASWPKPLGRAGPVPVRQSEVGASAERPVGRS